MPKRTSRWPAAISELACRIAHSRSELTLTQPPRVTALTGIDAVAHALETYVTKSRNPISLAFSREAWS